MSSGRAGASPTNRLLAIGHSRVARPPRPSRFQLLRLTRSLRFGIGHCLVAVACAHERMRTTMLRYSQRSRPERSSLLLRLRPLVLLQQLINLWPVLRLIPGLAKRRLLDRIAIGVDFALKIPSANGEYARNAILFSAQKAKFVAHVAAEHGILFLIRIQLPDRQ